MQAADHIDRQAAFSVHDFRDACARSDQRFEVFPGQAKLLHPELDRSPFGVPLFVPHKRSTSASAAL